MEEEVQGELKSITGQTLYQKTWLPEGRPKAILQLVHGMAEHIDRYADTAAYIARAGYIVVGHNHLGHGPAATLPGFFADANGWEALVDDTQTLRVETTAKYPDLPYFLLGHSMGSFVARCFCLQYGKGLAGLALSGTGHYDPATLCLGRFIAYTQGLFGGAKKPSLLLQKISSAGYNKRHENPRTAFDWLSTVNDVVDAYMADPCCGFPFTARGYSDLFTGLSRLHPKALSAMEKDVPVYLFSGEQDPVGGYGAGVRKVAEEIKAAGVTGVSTRFYPDDRHEVFNEKDREAVWEDLLMWMETCR